MIHSIFGRSLRSIVNSSFRATESMFLLFSWVIPGCVESMRGNNRRHRVRAEHFASEVSPFYFKLAKLQSQIITHL